MKTSTRPDPKHELFELAYHWGNATWRVFCRSPRGLLARIIVPNDVVWDRCKDMFIGAFGDRLIDGLFHDPAPLTEYERCERSWRQYLDRAEGKILLDGPAYPNTPENVLEIAKAFYCSGYFRADRQIANMECDS